MWRDDDGAWHWACLLCRTQHIYEATSELGARRHAAGHLSNTHGHRRVWIDYQDPVRAELVQLALPLAVKLRTVHADKGIA